MLVNFKLLHRVQNQYDAQSLELEANHVVFLEKDNLTFMQERSNRTRQSRVKFISV